MDAERQRFGEAAATPGLRQTKCDAALEESALEPHRLILEITESVMMQDVDADDVASARR